MGALAQDGSAPRATGGGTGPDLKIKAPEFDQALAMHMRSIVVLGRVRIYSALIFSARMIGHHFY
jgi:hypothetical protein